MIMRTLKANFTTLGATLATAAMTTYLAVQITTGLVPPIL
jgi:hypothetical protein